MTLDTFGFSHVWIETRNGAFAVRLGTKQVRVGRSAACRLSVAYGITLEELTESKEDSAIYQFGAALLVFARLTVVLRNKTSRLEFLDGCLRVFWEKQYVPILVAHDDRTKAIGSSGEINGNTRG